MRIWTNLRPSGSGRADRGHADSLYAKWMTYQREVNNGGYEQCFYSIGNV